MKSIDVFDMPKANEKTATVEVYFTNIGWFPGSDGDEWLPKECKVKVDVAHDGLKNGFIREHMADTIRNAKLLAAQTYGACILTAEVESMDWTADADTAETLEIEPDKTMTYEGEIY